MKLRDVGCMQAAMQPANAVNALPLILAVVGITVPLVGSNFLVWQLSLLWLLVVVVVVLAVRRVRPPRSTRVFCGLVALPMLFLLGWEGGWWLIPAVLAQVALDARAARAIAPAGIVAND